ncbi:helix-turn-helix domain-containing protein [Oceanibaculum pacificum]|uniref:HTH cro/C1-type domain-containing protein n=1 Tax=Oceanibaculum pacificum TaxID=580166 RepID=A0A154VBT3_9PROT|nr:helix-turn-helix domain-containing protein [Oceanibaculum pacificum]KZC98851.1 hypothetical protein AUP43_14670 [Oceanibaculum pacificum]
MSTKSSFRALVERREDAKAKYPHPSGSPLSISLSLQGDFTRHSDLVRLLREGGIGLKAAHGHLTRLAEQGRTELRIPDVSDIPAFINRLRSLDLDVALLQPPGKMDVRAIRERLHLTQEAFALRFALEPSTVRNWEQGRNQPDGPTRTLLSIIERHPSIVDEAVQKKP